MAERSVIVERLQLSPEVTEGTSLPATKAMTGAKIDLGIEAGFQELIAMGYKLPLLEDPTKEWSSFNLTGSLTYTEPIYYLSSVLKQVTPAAGGTASQVWTFNPAANTIETAVSYTMEQGQAVRAGKISGAVFTDFGVKLSRNGCTITGKGIGQRYTDAITMTTLTPVNDVQTISDTGATAGTFTLTVAGYAATAAINWNATAATIQAALQAIVGAGNATATGGPLPTTPVVVTFQGALGNRTLPVMTVTPTGITGGTVTVAHTTPGVQTEIPLVSVLGSQLDFFMDSSAGAIGSTKLTEALEIDWDITGMWGPFWAVNSANTSYKSRVQLQPKITGTIILESNAAGMTPLSNMRAGSTIYLRAKGTGALIETSHPYNWQNDLAVKINGNPTFSAQDGVKMANYKFAAVHDTGGIDGLLVVMENLQTAL